MLVDAYGRVARDLRVSVTDRCNFRCRYCMPPEGMPWLDGADLLSFDEITRIVRILVRMGISSIKLTGGEPLARPGLPGLVAQLRALAPDADISMTTNGYLLARHADELARSGLDRVTVSCDSLLRHRFAEITRRDALLEVRRGLQAAAAADLRPIKVNTVVMRGVNEDEIVEFAGLARETGYEVRFIEYMPLDAQDEWDASDLVPAHRILATIDLVYPLTRAAGGPAASTDYEFADGAPGRVGVIASVSQPFCETCDRLRITADGFLRACLFALEETDLRLPLRSGATDAELARLARACVAGKWKGHRIGKPGFVRPTRSMSQIGG